MPETASGKTLKAEEAAAPKDRQKKRGIRTQNFALRIVSGPTGCGRRCGHYAQRHPVNLCGTCFFRKIR
jgi:hypothetical protein